MTEEEKATEQAAVAAAQKAKEEAEAKTLAEQDPLKIELEKVQRKGKTREEKLLYRKKLIDQQIEELGIDGEPEIEDDSKPLTMGEFKKMQAQTATKTALQLADEVSNETERELLKYHLSNTIRSTGNPQEDLKLAQGLVNSVKNRQILEETLRKPVVKTHASGSGAPARTVESEEEFTLDEQAFMRAPFNLSKKEIIAARPK